jgi:hypothetical protein
MKTRRSLGLLRYFLALLYEAGTMWTPILLNAPRPPRVTLYRLLSTIWNSLSVNDSAEPATDVGAARGRFGDHPSYVANCLANKHIC